MRISDWSSDVCSSDLPAPLPVAEWWYRVRSERPGHARQDEPEIRWIASPGRRLLLLVDAWIRYVEWRFPVVNRGYGQAHRCFLHSPCPTADASSDEGLVG